MGKNSKKKSAPAPTAQPTPQPEPVPATGQPGEATPSFRERHPTASNLIFAGLCVYVAMLWLLALDQTFHWGIFGPVVPPTP